MPEMVAMLLLMGKLIIGEIFGCKGYCLFNPFTKPVKAIINPPPISPQKAPETPAKERPEAVMRKVIAAASRVSGSLKAATAEPEKAPTSASPATA